MLEESHVQTYTPQVLKIQKSQVGHLFKSFEEAFSVYNSYTKECGFSAKMSTSMKEKGMDELIWKQLVSFKERQKNEECKKKWINFIERLSERHKGVVRVDCKARLTIIKWQIGPNWIISIFVEKHNHVLSTPIKFHLL